MTRNTPNKLFWYFLVILLCSVSCRVHKKTKMIPDIHQAIQEGLPAGKISTGIYEMEMLRISPGSFAMGSPDSEPGHQINESPVKQVEIANAFYLGRNEVTQLQYHDVMGTELEELEDGNLPISQIQYRDALEFCRRLSLLEKIEVRLPTEAEWEYACRAGTQTTYSSGNSLKDLDQVAWYSGNAGGKPHDVAQKQANPWGLYDMHGNVWEFCADFIDDYEDIAGKEVKGRVSPNSGAMRGGAWMNGAEDCRSAVRMISDDMFGGAGFRIAISGK